MLNLYSTVNNNTHIKQANKNRDWHMSNIQYNGIAGFIKIDFHT